TDSPQPSPEEVVSAEQSFKTVKKSSPPSGGGGGGGRILTPEEPDPDPEPEVPQSCGPYLLEFIRYGADNNPVEVLKLQTFLRVFEGYNVPLSGVYDLTTYMAVRNFQLRYASDVLDPWGITEPTGFVFITTTLKINYIYCGITDPITLDLTNFYPPTVFVPAAVDAGLDLTDFELPEAPEDLLPIDEDGEADETPTMGVEDDGFLQLAALGVLDFFRDFCWLCWWLVLLLLLIILGLLYRLYRAGQDYKKLNERYTHLSDNLAQGLVMDKNEEEELATDVGNEEWQATTETDEIEPAKEETTATPFAVWTDEQKETEATTEENVEGIENKVKNKKAK
ncbi:MAG: hypothetical protein ACOCU8_00975, partial [Patescibacteria group bacterium]